MKDDCNQGSKDWYLPVRYTNIKDWSNSKYSIVGYISDLYYADVYRYNISSQTYEFEDWDSNGNNIFAEGDIAFGEEYVEDMDLAPDVYLGRLPCRNKFEVRTVVNKIVRYEKTSHWGETWFKRMISIGGKTFDMYNGQPDGEYLCNYTLDLMSDIIDEPIRVFASNNNSGGPRPTPKDIVKVFSEGAGFVHFEGHGNPWVWNTIWADAEYDNSNPGNWTGGITIYDFMKLKNHDKLPIVVVGGCHNALFNVTIKKTLKEGITSFLNIFLPPDAELPYYYWSYGVPVPECFSWRLVSKPYGGAIASTGCTGLGLMGSLNLSQPLTYSTGLEAGFFYQIGEKHVNTIGEAYTGTITKYINEIMIEPNDAYCITIYLTFLNQL